MRRLTEAELAEAERVEQVATPGPWKFNRGKSNRGHRDLDVAGVISDSKGWYLADIWDDVPEYFGGKSNGAAIALAHNQWPALLAEVRAARAVPRYVKEDDETVIEHDGSTVTVFRRVLGPMTDTTERMMSTAGESFCLPGSEWTVDIDTERDEQDRRVGAAVRALWGRILWVRYTQQLNHVTYEAHVTELLRDLLAALDGEDGR